MSHKLSMERIDVVTSIYTELPTLMDRALSPLLDIVCRALISSHCPYHTPTLANTSNTQIWYLIIEL